MGLEAKVEGATPSKVVVLSKYIVWQQTLYNTKAQESGPTCYTCTEGTCRTCSGTSCSAICSSCGA